MKVLMVNKFLYPKGGAEIYLLKLGKYLQTLGHKVEYFGMEDPRNTVGNSENVYTKNLDFHTDSIKKVTYPFKIIYSKEARKKISLVLDSFKPDIVHMNNINFQLTPSIIYEIKKHEIPIVQTVHDVQMVCPNHKMYIEQTGRYCTDCLSGNYWNCLKNRCIHNSVFKSFLASLESFYYHKRKTYHLVDKFICPSHFMRNQLVIGGIEGEKREKTLVLYNFSETGSFTPAQVKRNRYVLYFGRLSAEKGIKTLMSACKSLPDIHFVIAGDGPLKPSIANIPNVEAIGYKTGSELSELISNAEFTILPSEAAENCPLSVLESIALGTPVIGSKVGGIPELIESNRTGILFEGGNVHALRQSIQSLWNNEDLIKQMSKLCKQSAHHTISTYASETLKIYQQLL